MRSTMLRGALALAAVTGLLVAGCGGDDEPAAPEDVVDQFVTASTGTDAEALCETFTADSATQAAEEQDAETCEEGIEASFEESDNQAELEQLEGVEIGEATIDGETATVAITSAEGQEGEIPLVMEDGEWKIDLG